MRDLGALLTGTEARLVARGIEDEESVSAAFAMVDSGRRERALELVRDAGLRSRRDVLLGLLRGVEGARSRESQTETLWTMPGHLAGGGALTSSLVRLVEGAQASVVCSTFNFQETSGMWRALRRVSERAGVSVRVYLDANASRSGRGPKPAEVARWLAPGRVFETKPYDGRPVRNHAKFLIVDHRWLVVTSANFSWSAEFGNVELGVVLDDPGAAERVERELLDVDDLLYRLVTPGPS